MAEEAELQKQIQALLELHRKNRPVWMVLIGVMFALLVVGIVQLILMFKILTLLKVVLVRLS